MVEEAKTASSLDGLVELSRQIVSLSLDQHYELMRLYDDIKPEAALRLLAIWHAGVQHYAAPPAFRQPAEAAESLLSRPRQ